MGARVAVHIRVPRHPRRAHRRHGTGRRHQRHRHAGGRREARIVEQMRGFLRPRATDHHEIAFRQKPIQIRHKIAPPMVFGRMKMGELEDQHPHLRTNRFQPRQECVQKQ